MKVLIVNKFMYPRGGDCVCSLATDQLLRAHGHDTAFFAMEYPDNIDTAWNRYYASPIDFGGGAKDKLKAMQRMLGMGDIKKAFKRILVDFKPDIVHFNNIHSYLSPVIVAMARKAGARLVWTMHDYKLLCPSYSCLAGGEVCERCIDAGPTGVLKTRCMKGSIVASAMAWVEAQRWSRKRLEAYVDAFICPSQFMADKMAQGGFDKSKLKVLCNFLDPDKAAGLKVVPDEERGDYYCYVGRLSPEKGVVQMLEVAATLGYKLKILGAGPLLDDLRQKYSKNTNIEFLGWCDAPTVVDAVGHARCMIIPSRWYENNPLTVIEALSMGTPVIGADIGGIPELITPGQSGFTFTYNDPDQISQAICYGMQQHFDHEAIARDITARTNADEHYRKLLEIYKGQ